MWVSVFMNEMNEAKSKAIEKNVGIDRRREKSTQFLWHLHLELEFFSFLFLCIIAFVGYRLRSRHFNIPNVDCRAARRLYFLIWLCNLKKKKTETLITSRTQQQSTEHTAHITRFASKLKLKRNWRNLDFSSILSGAAHTIVLAWWCFFQKKKRFLNILFSGFSTLSEWESENDGWDEGGKGRQKHEKSDFRDHGMKNFLVLVSTSLLATSSSYFFVQLNKRVCVSTFFHKLCSFRRWSHRNFFQRHWKKVKFSKKNTFGLSMRSLAGSHNESLWA